MVKNCLVELSWEAEHSGELKSFDLQRSENGFSFFSIASINAAGSSTAYNFSTDQNSATAFYRIRLNNFDGSFQLSAVLPVKKDCNNSQQFALNIYPNPVSSVLQIILTSDKKIQYSVGIYNEKGQLVLNKVLDAVAGINLFSIDVHQLPASVYNVQLINKDDKSKITVSRFIKVNQ